MEYKTLAEVNTSTVYITGNQNESSPPSFSAKQDVTFEVICAADMPVDTVKHTAPYLTFYFDGNDIASWTQLRLSGFNDLIMVNCMAHAEHKCVCNYPVDRKLQVQLVHVADKTSLCFVDKYIPYCLNVEKIRVGRKEIPAS